MWWTPRDMAAGSRCRRAWPKLHPVSLLGFLANTPLLRRVVCLVAAAASAPGHTHSLSSHTRHTPTW